MSESSISIVQYSTVHVSRWLLRVRKIGRSEACVILGQYSRDDNVITLPKHVVPNHTVLSLSLPTIHSIASGLPIRINHSLGRWRTGWNACQPLFFPPRSDLVVSAAGRRCHRCLFISLTFPVIFEYTYPSSSRVHGTFASLAYH